MRLNTLVYYFREAFLSLVRNSWLSLAAVGTVTVSLLILGSSLLLVVNTDRLADHLESSLEISAFLQKDLKPDQVRELNKRINSLPGVAGVEFISKEQALEEMRRDFGPRQSILEGLDKDNPFPDAFRVKTRAADQVVGVAREIAALPGVDDVRYGQGVVEKLVAVTRWVRLAGMAAMIMVGAAAVFLISTTIRMSVFARRREIGIMKYLGATNWFVRFPFLLEGMVLGLVGALLAAVLVRTGYFAVVHRLAETLPFIPLVTDSQVLLSLLGGLVGLGLLIGALGSAISIHRFLSV
ncbi:FtsX-like permease family protein [Desulfofundulus thermobenzoicus]|uniref:Cell division protein FtsX n=1 Tax=Desulfofundulus thermobenzoicus TaxID=29376 RepID=A0A6N7ITT5_9FIRM|nr:permease-like cell division protein FtsX [Desulfofundulus thermobenzoicus]MQL53494.1 FtsX-like permease family protein [Desulfofundulus thermobenzoicus]HHW42722.1 ABC transporter permease [Desulfotomaculum sp.]